MTGFDKLRTSLKDLFVHPELVEGSTMAHIIIDGYNLIRQSKSLSQIEATDFEKGRLSLIYKAALYKRLKGHQITIVFDAAETENLQIEKSSVQGVRVYYSEMGQTADQVIIDLARKGKGQVIVVSSDHEILQAAKAAKCGVLDSYEFEAKLNEALMYETPERDEEPEVKRPLHKRWQTKKRGPSKRLPKAKRRAMVKI